MNNTQVTVPKPDGSSIVSYFLIVIALLLLVSLAGCHTVKQAIKTFDANPLEAAKYSASKFPVKEVIKRDTRYLPGKPKLVPGETIYVDYNCDSAVEAQMKEFATHIPKTVKVPVPVYQQVDTNLIIQESVQENTAKVAQVELEKAALQQQLADEKAQVAVHKHDAIENREWGKGWRGKFYMAISGVVLLLFLLIGGVLGKISHPATWLRR